MSLVSRQWSVDSSQKRGAMSWRRSGAVLVSFLLIAGPLTRGSDDEEDGSPKAALQALNEFIGEWKGSGGPEKRRVERGESWDETVSWSWKFKGNDAWLTMQVKNGRYLKSGELRYLPDQKKYQLTATDKDNKKRI